MAGEGVRRQLAGGGPADSARKFAPWVAGTAIPAGWLLITLFLRVRAGQLREVFRRTLHQMWERSGQFQLSVAKLLGAPLLLFPSLNSVGAEVGKPVVRQTASVRVSTTRFMRHEGEVIPWSSSAA